MPVRVWQTSGYVRQRKKPYSGLKDKRIKFGNQRYIDSLLCLHCPLYSQWISEKDYKNQILTYRIITLVSAHEETLYWSESTSQIKENIKLSKTSEIGKIPKGGEKFKNKR